MHFLHDLKPILACFRLDSAKTKKLLLVVLFAFFSFFSIGNRDISPLSEHAIEKSENIKIDQFENEITVSFQSPIFEWNLTPGGETISFAGSEILSVPGYPSIPYQSTVLSLPNIDYELDIQTSQAKIIHSPQNLFVLETGNFSSCNSTYPNSSIEVGDPFWYRDQYLVSITFYPILWDCNLNEFIWNQDLEISFKFEQNLSFEEENNKTLVDPILSDQENIGWKTDPPVLWGGDLRSSWSERVKIEVQEDGIYQVSYEDLHTIGFLNDFIDPHYIHIENQGREVATLFDGNDDNIFEPGESLLFYGQEFDGDYLAGLYQQQDDNWPEYNNWQPEFSHYMLEKYTETNIYWLYLSDTTGSRIQSQDRTPINTETITTFTDQVQFEEETVWWTTHFTNEDTWFWEDQKIYSFPEQFSYSIWLDDPVIAESVSTNLRADTISVTSSSSTSPDHHIQAFLNNQLLQTNIGMERCESQYLVLSTRNLWLTERTSFRMFSCHRVYPTQDMFLIF